MKNLLLFSIYAFFAFTTFAQTEATTKDGKKVILKDDGTWIYDVTSVSSAPSSLECTDLISTETDKVTGKSMTSSKNALIISDEGKKNGISIFFMEIDGTIVFTIRAVGAGNCIDDDNKMNILFRDGTRLELTNDGKFNCDVEFTLYFGGPFGKKKQLEMFRTKEVETMRIWTTKGYVEKDFNQEQSKVFMKTVDCLIK